MALWYLFDCVLRSHRNITHRSLHVLGLGAFRTHAHVERDGLADLQRVKLTVASAQMEENVGGTLDGDETEPFFGLGLDRTCSHSKWW